MRAVGRRALVVVVSLGTLASLLVTLPNFAAWTPPTPHEESVIAPGSAVAGDRFAEVLGAKAASVGDERPGDASRPDDGVSFDGPGVVPEKRTIPATSTPGVVGPAKDPVEVPALRTATSTLFDNGNGTLTVRGFTSPQFFKAADGSWQKIDNRVVTDSSRKGWLRNAAGGWVFGFGPIAANGSGGVEVSTGGLSFTVRPDFVAPGRSIAPEVVEGQPDTVIYRNVADGVDLTYRVTAVGLKEDVVLRAKPAQSSFSFTIDGAEFAADAQGELRPVGDAGKSVKVPAAVVVDREGAEVDRERAKPTLTGKAKAAEPAPAPPAAPSTIAPAVPAPPAAPGRKATTITVGVDDAWVKSLDAAAFPIAIDPSFTDGGDTWQNFWWNGVSTYGNNALGAAEYQYAGNAWTTSNKYWRGFIRFPQYQSYGGQVITSATVSAVAQSRTSAPVTTATPYGVSLYAVDGATSSWNFNLPSGSPISTQTVGGTGSTVSYDVTSLVQGWVNTTPVPSKAFVFVGTQTAGTSTLKALDTWMDVTYTTNTAPPAATATPNPENNAVTVLDAPTLSVAAVTDPNPGDTVTYRFQVDNDADFSSPAITSAWLASPSYTLAAGALDSATTWYWRVQTQDNHGATTTPSSGFTLRTTAFGYNGFSGYFKGLNTLGGNYVFTETDAHIASVGPALDLTRTFNTQNTEVGVFGKGWSTPYFMAWNTSGANIVITYPDGRKETHTPNGSGGWNPPAGYISQLSGTTAAGFTLEQGDNSIYTFGSGTTTGRLTQMKDPFGHQLNIDYTNFAASPQRILITDVASARSLTVKVTGTLASFKITSIEAPDPTGGTTPLVWNYTYDSTFPDRLVSACDARGTTGFCRTYTWDGSGRMWKVFDRKGQLDVQFGYSTYGSRVTSITDALGATTTFAYSQQATTPFNNQVEMTDARGNKWRQDYSPQGLLVGEVVPGVTQGWEYLYDTTTKMRTESRDPLYNSANRAAGHYSTIDYTTDLRAQVETSGVGTKTYKVHDNYGNIVKLCDGRSADVNNDKLPDADTYCTLYDYGVGAEAAKGLVRSKQRTGLAAETFAYTGTNDTYAYGSTTTYAPAGLMKTHAEPSGKVTTYEYNTKGDLVRVSDNTGPGTGGSTTRYEAETATHNYHPSSVTTVPPFSGAGYVEWGNFPGSSVLWTVTAATAGSYTLTFRSTTYQGPTARDIKVNGTTAATITVPVTDWLHWVDVTTTVNLNAGSNTIEIVYNGSTGGADAYFDYLDVTGTGGVGFDVRYAYDAIGRLTSTRECSADAYPCPTASTGGVLTTFTYDAVNNKRTETQDPVTNPVTSVVHRQQTTWTYDANSNVTQTAVEDLVGGDATRTTVAVYDEVDRVKQTTDAENNTSLRMFDEVGNVAYVRDAKLRWTKTTYNSRNLATKLDMLGLVVGTPNATTASARILSQTEYDNAGRRTATIDARSQRVEYSFDGGDRLTQTIMQNYRDDLPAGSPRDVLLSKVNSFDAADQPTSVSEGGVPGGSALRTTTFTYDSQGRRSMAAVSSVNMTTTWTYDDSSRVTKVVTARIGVATGGVTTAETRTTYDLASRVLSTTVENGTTDLVTTNAYDTRGVLKSTTSPGGSTTTFTADQLGRPVTATAPSVSVESNGGAPSTTTPAKTTAYNTFGNPTHSVDERGKITSSAYDKLGRVTAITYPSYTPPTGGAAIVPSESFTYDAVGNQIAHTDRRGYTTDYTFDIYNKVTSQLDPSVGGAPRGETVVTYDENGNTKSVTDPAGGVTNFTYDSLNRVRTQSQVVRPLTVNGTSIPGGTYTTTIEHDDLGNVTKTTTPAGVITSTTYDALGEALVVKNTNNTTIATASYDALGNTVIAADALGRQTRTVYDQAGRATSVGKYADGVPSTPATTSTSATYDANSNITAVVDGNGRTTTAAFDAIGRLTSVTTPVSAGKSIVTNYGYDAAGNLTRVRDGRAASPAPFYADTFDASNGAAWSALRWSTSTSASGVADIQSASGHLQMPASNNGWARATDDTTSPRNAGSTHQDAELTATVKSTTIGGGLTTRLWMRSSATWNGTNQFLQQDGYALRLSQGSGGVAITETVAGTETQLVTAAFSFAAGATYKVRVQTVGTTLRAKVWNSTGSEPGSWTVTTTDATRTTGTTAVSANTATNTAVRDVYIDDVAITPATSGSTLTAYDTVYTYNSWGLPETVVEAAAGAQTAANQRTFTREYNAGGLPTKDIAPDGTAGGIVVTAAFDELGQLTSENATGLTKTYGYDKLGRTTAISLPTGTQNFVYDDRGLLVGASRSTDLTWHMTATYNGDGQQTSRIDPSGTSSATYNNLGLATQITDASTTGTLNITYKPDYQIDRIDYGTPGSTTPYRTYTYDLIGRKATDVLKVNTTTKYDASYTYDGNSNVTSENVKNLYGASSTDELYTYTYDWSNRLTQDQRKIGTGAPTVTNYTYDDAGNRLTAAVVGGATKTWAYDQRGRIASASVEGNYTWDPRGTLDKTTNATGLVVDYTFDAMGRLTGYVGNGNNVTYSYDALDRIIDRTNTTTAQTTTFTYAGASTKPASTTTAGATKSYSRDPAGNVIGVKNGATARFAGTNNHTDLRFLFDTGGAITDTKTYDPTGNVIASTGTAGSELGYQSEYTDPTSNQVWMAARWYNPASATFQSRDTYNGKADNPISLNRYTYASSNYLNAVDPTGHAPAPGYIEGILQMPWEDGSCSAGFYAGGFLGLCQQDLDRYNAECGAMGWIIALDGTCAKPWAMGDPCGTNGVRGWDVNICVERLTPGTPCSWNGVSGAIASDQITCAPLAPPPSGDSGASGFVEPGFVGGGPTCGAWMGFDGVTYSACGSPNPPDNTGDLGGGWILPDGGLGPGPGGDVLAACSSDTTCEYQRARCGVGAILDSRNNCVPSCPTSAGNGPPAPIQMIRCFPGCGTNADPANCASVDPLARAFDALLGDWSECIHSFACTLSAGSVQAIGMMTTGVACGASAVIQVSWPVCVALAAGTAVLVKYIQDVTLTHKAAPDVCELTLAAIQSGVKQFANGSVNAPDGSPGDVNSDASPLMRRMTDTARNSLFSHLVDCVK